MEENRLYCAHCGAEIGEDDDFETLDGQVVCAECISLYTTSCDRCGCILWTDDSYGDDFTTLCSSCYHSYYVRCCQCSALLHEDDAYSVDGDFYCSDCYHEEFDRPRSIHEYSFKPQPIFYGDDSKRYFGVELEIDGAGNYSENADTLLAIANAEKEHLYCKNDGSLEEGFELTTHPMSLNYHKQFCWEELMRKAISMGYRSHQTKTCGLHCHINRSCLGETREEQDEVISRILFFVECNWAELLKFSRRTEYSINRWAARYGIEKTGRDILNKAKKGDLGRYAAVNLQNAETIEFRIFRGTLKRNTLIAALELVDSICDTAISLTEEGIANMPWCEFVGTLTEPELINYLKERRLYINEETTAEEDM